MAYTPLAKPGAVEKGDMMVPKDWPDLTKENSLKVIGSKYGKSAVQVMLNWGLSKGHVVIPKANSPENQRENMDVYDFMLNEDEIKQIDALD